jgi:hypothetical protein
MQNSAMASCDVLEISSAGYKHFLKKKLNFLEFCIGIDNGEAYPFWT